MVGLGLIQHLELMRVWSRMRLGWQYEGRFLVGVESFWSGFNIGLVQAGLGMVLGWVWGGFGGV